MSDIIRQYVHIGRHTDTTLILKGQRCIVRPQTANDGMNYSIILTQIEANKIGMRRARSNVYLQIVKGYFINLLDNIFRSNGPVFFIRALALSLQIAETMNVATSIITIILNDRTKSNIIVKTVEAKFLFFERFPVFVDRSRNNAPFSYTIVQTRP